MARYLLVVHSNPVAGREAEYDDWYDHRHLADVLRVPGVVAARRYDYSSVQMTPALPAHRHLALYEIEIDDIRLFTAAMAQRSNTESMPISSALGRDVQAQLWKLRDA